MRSRSTRVLAPVVLTIAVAGAGLTSAGAGAPPETTIRLASLERGEGPAVPQVLGTTILDGKRRIAVPGVEVQLLGMSDGDYVVLTYPRTGSARVQRVAPDGAVETIMTGVDGDTTLSRDGRQVYESVVRPDARTVVTVRDARTGDREVRRTFRGYGRVLDADRGRAVLGASSPSRTVRWNTGTGRTVQISGREGYVADIRADRFATITGTGEELCSTLRSLPPQSEVLWRSCRHGVLAVSPDGRRLVTTSVYSDGPVSHLQVRGHHGRLIAGYDTDGSFGRSTFETDRAVLVQAFGRERAAIVRCEVGDCERASRRIDAP